MADIEYRMMGIGDVDRLPIGCQGSRAEAVQRIEDLGSCAVLAFEGDQHVAQLQFRRYDAKARSPNSIHDAAYWGDFGDHAPDLSHDTLAVHCFHVGQVDDTDARDARYQGRGIGLQLLDHLLVWASEAGFEAIIAKASPSVRPVMVFMGGQAKESFEERGFETVASWVDAELRSAVAKNHLVDADGPLDSAARVSCCVLKLLA
jgi:GNAT superfamily N-acetyltransferase